MAGRGQKEKPRGFYSGRVGYPKHLFVRTAYLAVDVVLLLPILLITILSRLGHRPIDIGLGPLPTINSRYHRQALERYGYSCETFVYYTWYITEEFDVNVGRFCPRAFGPYIAYVFALFRYKCIYTYFTGGPLGFTTLLARCEPFLLQLAGIKTVVMPFGADIHVLSRAKSKAVIHGYAKDYPGFRLSRTRTAALIDWWTRGADHIVSGCDWVDYLYYWDTLMLSHFAIDTNRLAPVEAPVAPDGVCSPLRLLHAPNHRNLKGTGHILKAVEELKAEGIAIDLVLAEGIPNAQMPELIRAADVVVDQLVLGWYAMFALEGMAHGKPVVCRIRPDYRDLYIVAGLIEPDELPLIDADLLTIKETLRTLSRTPQRKLHEIGQRSRAFVEKHHSLEAVGKVFDDINRSIGLAPSGQSPT